MRNFPLSQQKKQSSYAKLQSQKEVKSNPKQPNYKKCAVPIRLHEKRCEIQGGREEMVVMVN